MKDLQFRKGEFITQNSSTQGSFAVFGGDVYEGKEGLRYSLLCYYNNEHFTQNSNGDFTKEAIFECDVDEETCDYIIEEADLPFWRRCTEREESDALRFLAEKKKIAFSSVTKRFRRLLSHEVISFDTPRSTGHCGGNVYNNGNRNTNPFYGKGSTAATPVKTLKTITRVVKDDWEQKEPICTIEEERTLLLQSECERLKYSFNVMATGITRPFYGNCGVRQAMYEDEYGCQDEYYGFYE